MGNDIKMTLKTFKQLREEVQSVTEGERGLWDNIHAKRKRIKSGSGERMRKPYSKGAPTKQNFKDSMSEDVVEVCCNECNDINGITEEIFESSGNELYEDWGEIEEENEGKKLNKPFLTPGGPKKRSVYVKNEKGNVVKVNFGDPNMTIKRDDPERRKSFRARHGCDNPGPKTKANYWSCKFWSSTPVSKL